MSQDVRYNFGGTADFSKFKTYKWVTIEGVKQAEGLTEQQIKDAFDPELAKKGLTKVDSATADLSIGYQFGVKKQQKFSSYHPEWGYGPGWSDAWYGDTASGDTSTIYEGELALDMYETAKHTLAYRGVASKAINPNAKPNERQKNLVKAVKKLMEHYPPVAFVGR
jgi:hypothetical protein